MLATEPKTESPRARALTESKRSVPLEIEGRRYTLGGRAARIAAWLTDACREVNDLELERIVIVVDKSGDGFTARLERGQHYD